ncbi:MAG: RnfABCDGE type electron transport complex subunit D [Elusimicrobia bacterium]|nr:RnfABCDGE type electron transport complex subunit D [Elusimicrobiota bacterium]
MPQDARVVQLAFLGSLIAFGFFLRSFPLQAVQVAGIFAGGLATQWLFLRRLGLERLGYKSALVTCCGLTLLVRSDVWWVPPLVSVLAAASKFVLRIKDRHLFNPANFGVVAALLFTGHAWVSPAQWGHHALFAGWIFLLGVTVVWRAYRSDVSYAFLACFLGLILLRVLYLGQRPAVFFHQLQSGSLLLFTFFMISDPKTIPDSRAGRLAAAALTALLAFVWQYVCFRQNGLFYALFLVTPLTALWDRLSPAPRFQWLPGGPDGTTRAGVVAS